VQSSRSATTLRVVVVASVSVVAILGSPAGGQAAAATHRLSPTPASHTPQLAPSGTTEQIRQLVQCGTTMYAVGSFTAIKSGTTTVTRNNVFSFSATPPYQLSAWDPDVNGTVNSIAFTGSDCSQAYIGGRFTSIGGTTVHNIAEIATSPSTSTELVTEGFGHTTNGEVDTLVVWHDHLLAGGAFTTVNGSSVDPYFASLDPATGVDDGYAQLAIAGNYNFVDDGGQQSVTNPTRIYNQQISHNGTADLVEGTFTTIGGQPRRQIAMLDLGEGSVSTDPWYPTAFNANCAYNQPLYVKAASWSPDDSTVYVAASGYKPAMGPGYQTTDPRAGMCDSASAFPSVAGEVTPNWINYTGCDSLYSTIADETTVYFGGHERFANNPNGCNAKGPGAISAPGMVGLSAANGSVVFDPTRARGLGADDMLLTADGLWIASDNDKGLDQCGGVHGHAGICLLPFVQPTHTTPKSAEHPRLTVSSHHRGRLHLHVSTKPRQAHAVVRVYTIAHHHRRLIRSLKTNRRGWLSATLKKTPGKTYRIRVKVPATKTTRTGYSAIKRVRVRR
jgi:hypothetical protein